MKNLFHAGKFLLLDMASSLLFVAVTLLTDSVAAGVALGMALGVAQIGWEVRRGRPVDTMQWVSLVLVIGSGAAALVTHDPRFIMLKLSVIYTAVGSVMLKRGWLDRYLPPVALQIVPDVAVFFGYAWAGLMFFSAMLNGAVALNTSLGRWAAIMSGWGTFSKLAMFLLTFATMRLIGIRRHRRLESTAMAAPPPGPERDLPAPT